MKTLLEKWVDCPINNMNGGVFPVALQIPQHFNGQASGGNDLIGNKNIVREKLSLN
jgi:hypothetical protein